MNHIRISRIELEPGPSLTQDSHDCEEYAFRRGYRQGMEAVFSALESGFPNSSLDEWANDVDDWRARCQGEFEEPPVPYFPETEAEKQVVGGLMLAPEIMAQMPDLKVNHFKSKCRPIFMVISQLIKEGISPDITAVKNRLADENKLGLIGGVETLVRLIECVGNPANTPHYANILAKKYRQRARATEETEINATARPK